MAKLASKFGVIKFIPNSVKQEIINIGVIVHSPKEARVAFKLLGHDPRIKHFITEFQYAEFRAFRRLLGRHLKSLNSSMIDTIINVPLNDENYLEKLQASLKEPFIIAKPEFIFTDNIDEQVEGLYKNLVLTEEEVKTKQKPLIKQVEERLISEGIEKYIERDIPVKNLPFNLNIEFGYRYNQVLDLIQPLSIQGSPRENYKEGMFWRDAIEKLQDDTELNTGFFIAIIKPPKNAQRLGLSELIKQFETIERVSIVNYNTREFDRLIYTLKNHGKLDRAIL